MVDYNFDNNFSNVIQARVSKEYSGNWTLDIKMVATGNPRVEEGQTVAADEQLFRVESATEERNFEELYLDIKCKHIFFDLENIQICPGKVAGQHSGWKVDHTFSGTIEEHINNLLEYDLSNNFSYAEGAGLDFEEVRSVDIEEGSILENLNTVLQEFGARVSLGEDSNNPYLITVNGYEHAPAISAQCEYSKNNINMSREYNEADRIDKLFAQAAVIDTGENKINEYGVGSIEEFRHFGVVENEAELNDRAQEYFDIRSEVLPRYSIDVAELKKLDSEHFAYEDWGFDVAKTVQVVDTELGINEPMIVMGYNYSLLEDEKYTSTLELGRHEREYTEPPRLDRSDRRLDAKDIIWTIINYIKDKVFGGGTKDVASELLKHTAPTNISRPSGFLFADSIDAKILHSIVSTLEDFKEGTATINTAEWEVLDVDAFIDENVSGTLFIPDMRRIIEYYIDTVATDAFNPPALAPQINSIYEDIKGEAGTIDSIAPTYLPDFISEKLGGRTATPGKNRYEMLAEDMIEYAYNQVGNPTEIYTEISGGRDGIISAINELFREMTSVSMQIEYTSTENSEEISEVEKKTVMPRMFVSPSDPDDTKGTDGDIWFRHEEGEE